MPLDTEVNLITRSQVVKDETTAGANTATRVGGLLEDISESKLNKQDFGTKQVTGVTVTAASFSLVSGLYEASISDANILATSAVDIIPQNSTIDIVIAAQFLPETDSSAGSVKVYAKNLPTDNFLVTLNILNAI